MNSCSTFHSVFFYIASLYFSTENHSKLTVTISHQSSRRTYPGFLVCLKLLWCLKDCCAKSFFFFFLFSVKQHGGRCWDQRRNMRRSRLLVYLCLYALSELQSFFHESSEKFRFPSCFCRRWITPAWIRRQSDVLHIFLFF